MDPTAKDPRSLAREGMQALRSGNPRLARASFEAIVAAGADDASACLGLAIACRGLQDGPAALAAVDRALGHDPRNLRALILKGDLLGWQGDARAASSFYLAAVTQARAAGQVPEDLLPELARAQAACERVAGDLEEAVRSRLAGKGLAEGKSSARSTSSSAAASRISSSRAITSSRGSRRSRSTTGRPFPIWEIGFRRQRRTGKSGGRRASIVCGNA